MKVEDITYVPGTVYRTRCLDQVYDVQVLPSYEELKEEKTNYAKSFYTQYQNTDPFSGKRLAEPTGSISMWCRTRPPGR